MKTIDDDDMGAEYCH